jgi:hypothetical protein
MQGPPAAAAKITLAAGTLRSGVNSALVHN